jgi:hypothetical protein
MTMKYSAAVFAHVVERGDVRMVQAAHGARLALEAFAAIWIRCDMLGEHLDRHGAIETSVHRRVDLAHPARPDQARDLVRAEHRAG